MVFHKFRLNLLRSLLLAASIFISATGCTSYFMRRQCEALNWYEYGEKVAMQGKRVSGDTFLFQCKEAEAKINEAELDRGFKKGMAVYCTPEQSFLTGKSGDFFSQEMCDGPGFREMKKRHQDGVVEYCKESNGYRAGSTGRKYNGICSKDSEVAFLKEFNRGRRQYLVGQMQAKNNEVHQINMKLSDLERSRTDLNYRMHSINSSRRLERTTVYDPATGTSKLIEQMVEDPGAANERHSISSRISSADRDIQNQRNQQSQLQKEINDITAELAVLN
jgi:hypothetical protein